MVSEVRILGDSKVIMFYFYGARGAQAMRRG